MPESLATAPAHMTQQAAFHPFKPAAPQHSSQRRRSWPCRLRRSASPRAAYSTNDNALGDTTTRLRSDSDSALRSQAQIPAARRTPTDGIQSRPPIMPAAVRSYRVPLWNAMSFNGPAPEIINGRLAMIGIIAAAINEAKYSEPVLQQVQHVPIRIALLAALVTYSSLIPILKGAKSEAFGIFTPRAEITNARAAMLGFATLLLLEDKSHVPFF